MLKILHYIINSVTNSDFRFKENVKKSSSILRDNPIPILDNAVFWIEYVIRHKGAPHLQTTANRLYWFQYYLLDVIAFVSFVLLLVSYSIYKLCISRLLKKRTKQTVISNDNSKSEKKQK